MRTILITYGCLSCLFSAGYGEENQPTVSDIPSCGILEAGKQTEIAALEQAAEQGDVQAQCRLVVIYARGEKIPKDERKAFAWASRLPSRATRRECFCSPIVIIREQGYPKTLSKRENGF